MTEARVGTLRIIGGRWRTRRITFPDAEGLRPTPNRVRETLFNWLAPEIQGSRCLDLFAGSGALSIEALSRGAAHVTAVDRSGEAIAGIEQQLEKLGGSESGDMARCLVKDALRWLESVPRDPGAFDIVFIDPPFGEALAPACCALLTSTGMLSPGAAIYIESAERIAQDDLPEGWNIARQKRTNHVHYCLCRAA